MDARCQCGALTARVDEKATPLTVACHCRQCQQRSGSPFGVIGYFPVECVRISGEAREFTRGSHAGTRVTNGFCPTCGTTIYVRLEKNPALMGIPVGTFGDNVFPMPDVSVWEGEKHYWVELPEGVRKFARGSDGN